MPKIRTKNVDEIDTRCQFHQGFMYAFFVKILATKTTKLIFGYVTKEKLLNSLSYKKGAHKK
jgi:hypothetical protein